MNKIFFDVGANRGTNSIHLAEADPNLTVYAFEPTPFLIDHLKIKTGHLSNYHIIEKAVSDFNGTDTFNVAGNADWGCSSLLNFSDKSKTDWPGRADFNVTEQIKVTVIRLDSFIEANNIEKIDYLHIDTQGSDLKVLQGLGKYIAIVKEGMMEAASKPDVLYVGQNTVDDSCAFLLNNGFKIIDITTNDNHDNEMNILFQK